MFFCWSLLSPHRSNSDIISCCFRFVNNFFYFFELLFFSAAVFLSSEINNTTCSVVCQQLFWIFLIFIIASIFYTIQSNQCLYSALFLFRVKRHSQSIPAALLTGPSFATCSWTQSLRDLPVGAFNLHWQKHPPHSTFSTPRTWSGGMLICSQPDIRNPLCYLLITE